MLREAKTSWLCGWYLLSCLWVSYHHYHPMACSLWLLVLSSSLIVKEFSVPPDELFVECPNEAAVPLREVPMVIRKSSGLQFVRFC